MDRGPARSQETSLDTWTGDPHGLGMPGSSEAHDRQEHMRIAGKDTRLLSQLCATGASVVKDSPNSMANPQLSEGVIRKIHETNESTDKPLLQVLVVKRIDWGQSTTAPPAWRA